MTKDEVFGKSASPSKVGVDSGSKFLGAVFLYMFIALAITALVATGMGALIQYLINKGNAAGEEAVAITFIVAFVLYIPTLIWVQFSCLRNGKSMIPGYVVYSIIMGVLISSFTVVIPFYELAITFGITCLAFGLMTLIGWFSKRDVSKLAIIGSGILIGSLFLICFNCSFYIFSVLRNILQNIRI